MYFVNVKDILPTSQIGFDLGNRTADHTFTMKTLYDKYVSQYNNKKIINVFVDVKKTFDSVWHEGLLLKLFENGIGDRFCIFNDLIRNLYSNTRLAEKLSKYDATSFLSCIRQGWILSPVRFNLFINEHSEPHEKEIPDFFLLFARF